MAGKKPAAAKGANLKVVDSGKAQPVNDRGLSNLVTGMNLMTGRRGYDVYSHTAIDEETLQAMYRSDWMSRKIIDIPSDDMTQEWRAWQANPKQIEALENAEKKLRYVYHVNRALKYSRLFGGGAIISGDGGRDLKAPMTVEGVQKDGLKYLVSVPRQRLQANGHQLNWDPAAENFGQPEFYQLQSTGNTPAIEIHWSRVHRFIGAEYPDPMMEQDPWGDSVLDAVYNAVRDAGLSSSSAATLMEEAKIDVVTMEGLEGALSDDAGSARVMERLRLMRLGKTLHKVVLMGGRETYESKQLALNNVDKVLYTFLQIVSGACDIPATRFLSQSPAGLNSTGDSDMRNYAGTIQAMQNRVVRPSLSRLDDMLLRHTFGSIPKKIWYEWASIWTMSPKEAAEVNKLHAEADTAYANSGMIPTAALEKTIQNRMVESGQYPGLEDALAELTPDELDMKRPEPAPIPVDPNKLPPDEPPAAAKKPATKAK